METVVFQSVAVDTLATIYSCVMILCWMHYPIRSLKSIDNMMFDIT